MSCSSIVHQQREAQSLLCLQLEVVVQVSQWTCASCCRSVETLCCESRRVEFVNPSVTVVYVQLWKCEAEKQDNKVYFHVFVFFCSSQHFSSHLLLSLIKHRWLCTQEFVVFVYFAIKHEFLNDSWGSGLLLRLSENRRLLCLCLQKSLWSSSMTSHQPSSS